MLSDRVILFLLTIITLYFITTLIKSGFFQNKYLQNFSVVFVTIVLEGMPFIIIGTVLSSVIHIYLSDEIIMSFIPSKRFYGVIVAAFIGIIIPVCECGIVSVIRKLLEKKIPVYIAVTLLTAMPIVNPIVIITTCYAFPDRLDIVFIRTISGLFLSMLIGLIVSVKYKTIEPSHFLRDYSVMEKENVCSCGHLHCQNKKPGFLDRFFKVIEHSSFELYVVGRFFIMGSFLAAFFRTCFHENTFEIFSENRILSILVMMGLAYLLSVCSESDAFIARKFSGIFPDSALMGFMVFGPMIDVKNTIMLLNLFKLKFTVFLIISITFSCFISALIMDYYIF